MKTMDDFYDWGIRSRLLKLTPDFCQDMLEEKNRSSEQIDMFFEGFYNSKEVQNEQTCS